MDRNDRNAEETAVSVIRCNQDCVSSLAQRREAFEEVARFQAF